MDRFFINKLDAARRQLETAALLYFNDRDIISVHTLAAAAYEIVETIAQKRGSSTLVQRSLLNFLPDDLVKDVRKAMRTPQNFLKHADKDPEAQLEFEPNFTELILLDAMATYAQITGDIPSIFNAFSTWLGLQKPDMFGGTPEAKEIMREAQRHFGSMTRLEFLKKSLSTAATIRP